MFCLSAWPEGVQRPHRLTECLNQRAAEVGEGSCRPGAMAGWGRTYLLKSLSLSSQHQHKDPVRCLEKRFVNKPSKSVIF